MWCGPVGSKGIDLLPRRGKFIQLNEAIMIYDYDYD